MHKLFNTAFSYMRTRGVQGTNCVLYVSVHPIIRLTTHRRIKILIELLSLICYSLPSKFCHCHAIWMRDELGYSLLNMSSKHYSTRETVKVLYDERTWCFIRSSLQLLVTHNIRDLPPTAIHKKENHIVPYGEIPRTHKLRRNKLPGVSVSEAQSPVIISLI